MQNISISILCFNVFKEVSNFQLCISKNDRLKLLDVFRKGKEQGNTYNHRNPTNFQNSN